MNRENKRKLKDMINKEELIETLADLNIESYIHLKDDINLIADMIINSQSYSLDNIKFKGQRIDNKEWVEGYYFVTPLTDENSGTNPDTGHFFLCGEKKHCISTEHGVVFTVIPESIGVKDILENDCGLSDFI